MIDFKSYYYIVNNESPRIDHISTKNNIYGPSTGIRFNIIGGIDI